MKIYTKTGDDGTTGTLGGGRVGKDSDLMEALGSLDELNASLGVLAAMVRGHYDRAADLHHVQSRLFDVGAELAAEPGDDRFLVAGLDIEVQKLEESIDFLEQSLVPLRAFILPGGTPESAQSHVCRTMCRRAERRVIHLAQTREVRPDLFAWLNRLSDWLFVLARTLNARAGVADTEWKKQ